MEKLLETQQKYDQEVTSFIDFWWDISILSNEDKRQMYKSILYCSTDIRNKFLELINKDSTRHERKRLSKIESIKKKMDYAQMEYVSYWICNIYNSELWNTLVLAKEVFLPKDDKKWYTDEIIVYQWEKKVYERVMENVKDIR